jgi:ferric-dicitrate binding protein FerR (iron transport regulator)
MSRPNSYAEQNQREAAAWIAKCKDLPTAIEYLAVWADWEADDPKVICENIAKYLKGQP